MDKGASLRDRAGGLRPEPAAQSQPEALIPSAALLAALKAARDDLLTVGNDYPGSSCQEWCAERARRAWNAAEPWKLCPSTHCGRAEECRSVNECSADSRVGGDT